MAAPSLLPPIVSSSPLDTVGISLSLVRENTMSKLSGSEKKRAARLRDEAYVKQRGLCYWCGGFMLTKLEKYDSASYLCSTEHVIPIRNGGKTTRENIVAAHRKCNNGRKDKMYCT